MNERTVVSPLRHRVLVHGQVNAAFMQQSHATEHFNRCIDDCRDLPGSDIKLAWIDNDGAFLVREHFTS